MEEQEHPEKLKEIATTVAGVILKQKMSDANPLGRECKLQFVAVENFKNLVHYKELKEVSTLCKTWFKNHSLYKGHYHVL